MGDVVYESYILVSPWLKKKIPARPPTEINEWEKKKTKEFNPKKCNKKGLYLLCGEICPLLIILPQKNHRNIFRFFPSHVYFFSKKEKHKIENILDKLGEKFCLITWLDDWTLDYLHRWNID